MIQLADLYNVKYNIELELKIRKLLEQNTDFTFEFQKNEKDCEDDIIVFRYNVFENNHEKCVVGYIEIEISTVSWITDYPEFWKEVSYLKRKLFIYDWDKNRFTTTPVKNYRDCLYVKFNKTITDCHFNSKGNIINKFYDAARNGRLNELKLYNDSYYVNEIKNKNQSGWGIESFIDYCKDFFGRRSGIKINE